MTGPAAPFTRPGSKGPSITEQVAAIKRLTQEAQSAASAERFEEVSAILQGKQPHSTCMWASAGTAVSVKFSLQQLVDNQCRTCRFIFIALRAMHAMQAQDSKLP